MGRPVTKTPEEREEKRKQWFKDNPRTEYMREYKKKSYQSVKGKFVIEHKELYKRMCSKHTWVPLSLAKVYKSKRLAEKSVKQIGYGKVVEL